jgi:hypothetical protein
MSTTDHLRQRLDAISASTATAAEALGDGAALDLPSSVLAESLLEVEMLAGRLDLVLARLADAVDPVGVSSHASCR